MIEITIRQIWGAVNNAYRASIGTESIGLLTILVLLHFFLAIATLGLGDRTVCDILRPLRKIFRPDTESALEGIFEIIVAIPRALIYYAGLYVRSYFLAIRVLLWLWAAAIVALLVPLAASVAAGIIYGFNTPISQLGQAPQLIILSFWPALAFFYWRFDGRRVIVNIKAAFQC